MAQTSNKLQSAEQSIYTLLGFAQRSGKLYGGGEVVIQAIAKRQVKLVLLAWDLSENSLSKLRQRWQQQNGISIWRFGSKEQLGAACGKPPRGIWGLGDENFCKGVIAKLELLDKVVDHNGKKMVEKFF